MTQLILLTPPPRHPLLRIETKTEAERSLWSVLAGVAGVLTDPFGALFFLRAVATGLLIAGAIFAAAWVWAG